MRSLDEIEIYKVLGISETDSIKQVEMKEKLRKSISRERESYSRPKYCRNFIKKIITWAVLLVRILGPYLNLTRKNFNKKRYNKKTNDNA